MSGGGDGTIAVREAQFIRKAVFLKVWEEERSGEGGGEGERRGEGGEREGDRKEIRRVREHMFTSHRATMHSEEELIPCVSRTTRSTCSQAAQATTPSSVAPPRGLMTFLLFAPLL